MISKEELAAWEVRHFVMDKGREKWCVCGDAWPCTPHRLVTRVRRLEAALEDFKDHGVRHDMLPTTSSYFDWTRYLRSVDDGVRGRALVALGDPLPRCAWRDCLDYPTHVHRPHGWKYCAQHACKYCVTIEEATP